MYIYDMICVHIHIYIYILCFFQLNLSLTRMCMWTFHLTGMADCSHKSLLSAIWNTLTRFRWMDASLSQKLRILRFPFSLLCMILTILMPSKRWLSTSTKELLRSPEEAHLYSVGSQCGWTERYRFELRHRAAVKAFGPCHASRRPDSLEQSGM